MSRMKLVKVFEDNGHRVKVHKDYEWGEYRVGPVLNGVVCERMAYYTDDKDDAFGTAEAMLKHEDWKLLDQVEEAQRQCGA